MKATPHATSALGYFEDLTPSELGAFRGILLEIGESPQSFFSVEAMTYCDCYFAVVTENETFSSDRDDISEVDDFIAALGNQWVQASITHAASWLQDPELRLEASSRSQWRTISRVVRK